MRMYFTDNFIIFKVYLNLAYSIMKAIVCVNKVKSHHFDCVCLVCLVIKW